MKKVLVVEDNETNLYLMKFILSQKGYEVIIAKDGIDGVKKAISEVPDLILMDIQLPKMDGYDATMKIREHSSLNQVPIIAITSFAMPGDREKCIAKGYTDYIEKPINPEDFLKIISSYLE